MKRSELYERIWSTPASKVAEDLGVSGSRVAAICKRHSVPTPARGYWAKLGVGKHVPKTPLPQPEADYDIKIGTAKPTRGGSWLADGVLLRPSANEKPQLFDEARPPPSPAAAWPPPPAARTTPAPQRTAPKPRITEAEVELFRAAATELQEEQAIRSLVHAVAVHAVHAPHEEAERILSWIAGVRTWLEEHDPIAALLHHASRS